MRTSRRAVWLASLVGVLATIASGAGLVWPQAGEPFSFTSLHGQTVPMYGRGLYRLDSLVIGAGLRGTDAVTIGVCLPLLVASIRLYGRGSLRGAFLLVGALAYFVYQSASMALGAAYNSLFLVYVAYFSSGLFALGLTWTSIDLAALPRRVLPGFPHRGASGFLFAAGAVLGLVWVIDIVGAQARGEVPATLGSYTTVITYVLDLAIIVPAALMAGTWLRRRVPAGYVLACAILALCALIGVVVLAQTAAQLLAGVTLTTGQIAAFVLSFVILSAVALWFAAGILRSLDDVTPR